MMVPSFAAADNSVVVVNSSSPTSLPATTDKASSDKAQSVKKKEESQRSIPSISPTTSSSKRAVQILNSLEPTIGRIDHVHDCWHDWFEGKLYIGTKGIAFLGSTLVFVECHTTLLWNEIQDIVQGHASGKGTVVKNTAENPGAITIVNGATANPKTPKVTGNSTSSTVTFRSFKKNNARQVYETIISLHQQAQKQNEQEEDHDDDNDVNQASQTIYMNGTDKLTVSTTENFDDQEVTAPPTPSKTLQQIIDETNGRYSKVLFENVDILSQFNQDEIPDNDITAALDHLHTFVFEDNAKCSIPRFMESEAVGDVEVNASLWQEQEGEGETGTTRTIFYRHPVPNVAPMMFSAPPTARARKEQTLQRWDNVRYSDLEDEETCSIIILDTDTHVEDVPMVDGFYVSDRIMIVCDPAKNAIQVSVFVEIQFIRTSTLFRSIISSTTLQEYQKWYQNWLSHVQNELPEEFEAALLDKNKNRRQSLLDARQLSRRVMSVVTPSAATTTTTATFETTLARGGHRQITKKTTTTTKPATSLPFVAWMVLLLILCLQVRILREMQMMQGNMQMVEEYKSELVLLQKLQKQQQQKLSAAAICAGHVGSSVNVTTSSSFR